MDAIIIREKKLLENSVILSAIYTDPRFKFVLSLSQNIKAQDHLIKLFDKINQRNPENDQNITIMSSSSSYNVQPSTSTYFISK